MSHQVGVALVTSHSYTYHTYLSITGYSYNGYFAASSALDTSGKKELQKAQYCDNVPIRN